ncbi:MAG TPA: class I SAM-dependent methyltransferase [Pirellulales bacterium]|jgi:SAM-dependent methyltransferase|nr:class I SAM-dependent methyltransferase [Pirellulales bacterium]
MTTEAVLSDSPEPVDTREPVLLRLSDGTRQDLSGLSEAELCQLQWQEERYYAQQILAAPKGSSQRAEITGRGYDAITTLLRLRSRQQPAQFAMGHSPRYERLVVRLLRQQRARGVQSPTLFEIGFGSGLLLERIFQQGFAVAGLEVSPAMHELASQRLGPGGQLHLGDLNTLGPETRGKYHVAFWNDVFEHIAPDEISACLRIIYELLAPGGVLVTITPNWHTRPSDITSRFRGPRSPAEGFHLREYTLREVTSLLRQAGFGQVATPLFVTRQDMVFSGAGLACCKRWLEPTLEWLPFRVTRLLSRGFGLDCTIARKA